MVEYSESLRMVKKYWELLRRAIAISNVELKDRPMIDHYFSIVFFCIFLCFQFLFLCSRKENIV